MHEAIGRPGRRAGTQRAISVILLIAVAAFEYFSHGRPAAPVGTGPVEVHYAPDTDLERIDRSLIASATRSIDVAAYLLTDVPVIEALAEAATRGVAVRVYLDGGQEASGPGFEGRLRGLRGAQRIEVRLKAPGADIMHLKSYVVDRRVLRTGSANFTFSGLKREDDDLVIIRDATAVAAFTRTFEAMWRRGARAGLAR